MAPHIILILSGKGGVGKSSVTTQLALTLCLRGKNVGVLDLDLTGPSLPRFFGIEASKITQSAIGLDPAQVHAAQSAQEQHIGSLHVMSLGFILGSRDTAVIWRGPKKTAMVRQFLTGTAWPAATDYLLVDTPPGTSDEHIALLETLLATPSLGHVAGAVVVTTPQAVAISDVRKELGFCRKTNTYVLGVLENMAGFVCPHCSECTNVFSKGGGQVMAEQYAVPFLGSVPLDPAFGALVEEGTRPTYPKTTNGLDSDHRADQVASLPGELLVHKYTSCELSIVFRAIVDTLLPKMAES